MIHQPAEPVPLAESSGVATTMTTPFPQPCFIVGAPRSGTTWIQRLLQSHPAICGGEESHFFNLFGSSMRMMEETAGTDRPIGPAPYMSRAEFLDMIELLWHRFFDRTYEGKPQALVHLEKTPFHCFSMNEIITIFPQAKFIFLVRDSRAVSASLMSAAQGWGSNWAPATAKEAALSWHSHNAAVQNWVKHHPNYPILTVRYEDVLADMRAQLGRMLDFLLPGQDHDLDKVLADFEASQSRKSDPSGFARVRGATGWQSDLSLWSKLVIWRYTRKKMASLGYDITPFH